MNWKQELEEKLKREKFADKLGGDERVKRQHNSGRYTIRERIKILCDKSTFHEIGKIAGKAEYDKKGKLKKFTPSNFVMGRGKIDGRIVVVGGDDFRVRGGAADAAIAQKQIMAEQFVHGRQNVPQSCQCMNGRSMH